MKKNAIINTKNKRKRVDGGGNGLVVCFGALSCEASSIDELIILVLDL